MPFVLAIPIKGKHLVLYITALDHSLSALLAHENAEGNENPLYYLIHTRLGMGERYSTIGKECLVLIFAIYKLASVPPPLNTSLIDPL